MATRTAKEANYSFHKNRSPGLVRLGGSAKAPCQQAACTQGGRVSFGSDFYEEHVSDNATPEATTHHDFPFDEVEQDLGLSLPESDPDQTARSLMLAVRWVAAGLDLARPSARNAVYLRVMAILWLTNQFEDESLRALCRRLKIHNVELSRETAALTRTFGVRNGNSAHFWNSSKAGPVEEDPQHVADLEDEDQTDHEEEAA